MLVMPAACRLSRTRRSIEVVRRARIPARNALAAGLRAALWLLLAAACFTAAQAAPVTPGRARKAVSNWIISQQQRPLGARLSAEVRGVRTFRDEQGEALYYVVMLKPEGYVITPADDLVEPILAFSPEGDFDAVEQNPFYALANRDIGGRVRRARARHAGAENAVYDDEKPANDKWKRLTADGPVQVDGMSSISDVRVPPLVQSKWNQSNVGSAACYNYYTPPNAAGSTENYPCGCVATGMAQVMRYWQHPTAGIGTATFTIYICGSPTTRSTRGGDGSGGPYDWANMPLVPSSSATTAQRQAIGALCADSGVAVNMDYCSSGSGITDLTKVVTAFKNTFGYANIKLAYGGGAQLPSSTRNKAINASLCAGSPTMLAIVGGIYGHYIVCDGFGYNSGTLYHHVNMGWGGAYDAWYALPNIDSSPPWDTIVGVLYNIFTSITGEIISGRVLDTGGSPLEGVTLTAVSGGSTFTGVTDSRGIYAIKGVTSNRTYTVTPSKPNYSFTAQSVSVGKSTDNTTTVGNVIDLDFSATGGPPSPPPDGTPTAASTGSITWRWTDVSDETGYRVKDLAGINLSGDLPANTVSWTESGLTPNTQYTRRIYSFNSYGESPGSAGQSRYTLAKAGESTDGTGATGNVYCTTAVKNVWYPKYKAFTFSNPAGFGTGGTWKASSFEYKWNKSAAEPWTAAGAAWTGGTISLTGNQGDGDYYLHVRALNGDGVPNNSDTLDYGPFKCDATEPTAVTVTDEGSYTPSLNTLKASWTAAVETGSGLNHYEYAVGTSPSLQNVKGWSGAGLNTSFTIGNLPLAEGTTYYVQVRSVDNAGNFSAVAASDGILAAPGVSRIGQAWQMANSVEPLSLRNKTVTAKFSGAFYLEEADRSAAVRVVSNASVTQGRSVSVAGVLGISGGQRALIGDVVIDNGPSASNPTPVALSQKYLGGAAYNALTPGVTGGTGLYNIGMLVRCWGRVDYYNVSNPADKYFYLDDGSGLSRNGHKGVLVRCGAVTPPAGGTAVVTGIVSIEYDGAKWQPVLLIRDSSDIRPL